jgi:hypothetical protein
MDVDQAHFPKRLLDILRNIANATFVTFDLEMSGITTRPKYSSGDRSHDVGKPSLQQQYEEMKSAAESFQILQMGLTCVEEDREKGEWSSFVSALGCGVCPFHLDENHCKSRLIPSPLWIVSALFWRSLWKARDRFPLVFFPSDSSFVVFHLIWRLGYICLSRALTPHRFLPSSPLQFQYDPIVCRLKR